MTINWQRLNLLSGAAFVIVGFVAFSLLGPPELDDSAKIVRDFSAHRDRVLCGGYIACLGLMALVLWGWSWRTLLAGTPHAAAGTAVLVGVLLSVAFEFPVPGFFMTLAFISNQPVDPGVARMLVNAAQMFSYLDYFPNVLMFLAIGWAILASGVMNRWWGFLAFPMAAISLVIAFPPLKADFVGIITLLYMLALSIAMFVAAGKRVPAAVPAAAMTLDRA